MVKTAMKAMKAAKGTAKVQPKAGPASLNEKLKTWIKQEGLHDTADPDGADAESVNVDPQKSLKYNKMKACCTFVFLCSWSDILECILHNQCIQRWYLEAHMFM